jgi:diketogulonate reductase-like aldo/keto reductase
MKKYKLKDGNEIPAIGFGTYQLSGDEAYDSVLEAINVGYRHIDTADRYGNHAEVGRAIKDSGVKRKNIFLTSKVWRTDLWYDDVLDSTKRFLEELSIDYLDLLLVHWPNNSIPISKTFSALEKLKKDKLIKSLGVSNFTINHLKEVMDEGFIPVNNQVEYHPSLAQPKLREFCEKNNIKLTAYSPLAQGKDLKLNVIRNLAEKYEKPEVQVVINWIMHKGLAVIPRSADKEHIKQNFQSLEWEMEREDVEKIDKLDKENRIINPPYSEFDY